jgi:protein-S-isoprenylcysteine O-methyltransferase Ste14
MRATDFEFRHRFWLFGLLFGVSFWLYALDHRNAGEALARLLASGHDLQTAAGQRVLHGVFWAGALLVGLAVLLRTWASAYLDSERVHDPNLRTEGVVADGPYRHLRNPLYFGNLLLAVGMGLAASRLGMALLLVGHAVLLSRLIGREEAGLLATQGEPYRAYFAAVPRFWPSLRPRVQREISRPVGARPSRERPSSGCFSPAWPGSPPRSTPARSRSPPSRA